MLRKTLRIPWVMGSYERFLLPKVVNFTCSMKPNMRQRAKVVPLAWGSVLEVGFGSGLNLPFYDSTKVHMSGRSIHPQKCGLLPKGEYAVPHSLSSS